MVPNTQDLLHLVAYDPDYMVSIEIGICKYNEERGREREGGAREGEKKQIIMLANKLAID